MDYSGSPFRTQLSNCSQLSENEPSSQQKETTPLNHYRKRISFYLPLKLKNMMLMDDEIKNRDSEREEMLMNAQNLMHKNNMALECLKREESIRQHQITVMKKTHETQLDIKNALIKNLEDIINEQEARIFQLDSCLSEAGIDYELENFALNSAPTEGVKKLHELIDNLTHELVQSNEKLMSQQDRETSSSGESTPVARYESDDCIRNLETRLQFSEIESRALRQERDDLKGRFEYIESAYKELRLDFERMDVELSEKLSFAENRECDLHRKHADEKAKWKCEQEVLRYQLENERNSKMVRLTSQAIEELKLELSDEQKRRKDLEVKVAECEQAYIKSFAECNRWKAAVHELEKELESQSDKYESKLRETRGKLQTMDKNFTRLKRESVSLQERQADLVISLDCFRASLRCLKDQQASLLLQTSTFISEMQDNYVSMRQKTCRNITRCISDLIMKYTHECKLRKQYHNELIELRGNIRVFGRIRPFTIIDNVDPNNEEACVKIDRLDDRMLIVENNEKMLRFELDYVFDARSTQEQVFNEIRPLLTSCIDGYNVCIFAYGPTGSGKTYTMDGPPNDPGINPRALAALFEEAESRNPDWEFTFTVSMLEIYNECLRDLLSGRMNLEIKMTNEGPLDVPGLEVVEISNLDDIAEVLEIGRQNRSTASTRCNDASSRSHEVLRVRVMGRCRTSSDDVRQVSALHLVDLAGSERLDKSQAAAGERLRETQSINKSLSALGDVICALRNRRQHVPFRNSKLTYLLQDALSGDSKTLMVVQAAPTISSASETACTMNFAIRVKGVELGPASVHRNEMGGASSVSSTTTSKTSTATKSASMYDLSNGTNGTPRRTKRLVRNRK